MEVALDNIENIKYFQSKRDYQLERFIDAANSGLSFQVIENRYNGFIRKEKQLRLMEDASIISTFAKAGILPNNED